jgi:hypothetical protein
LGQIGGLDPSIDCQTLQFQISCFRHIHEAVDSIKIERLPNFAWRKSYSALKRAVVTVLNVVGVAVARPPTDHSRRRRCTGCRRSRSWRRRHQWARQERLSSLRQFRGGSVSGGGPLSDREGDHAHHQKQQQVKRTPNQMRFDGGLNLLFHCFGRPDF